MLTALTIQDFRGIGRLELPELGRVNLFVGPNSSGKTTVLGAAAFVRDAAAGSVTKRPSSGWSTRTPAIRAGASFTTSA